MFASTIGPDGCIYVADDRAEYAIDVYGPDGALRRTVRRGFTPHDKLALEKNRLQAVFDLWASRNQADLETHVETVAVSITNLYVADDGHLWVEHSRSHECGPDEAFLTYASSTPTRFERQVALVCEGDPFDDELFWVGDDMVVIVKGACPHVRSMAAAPWRRGQGRGRDDMEVVCYRLSL